MKNIKKQVLAMILALAMIFSLSGCGANKSDEVIFNVAMPAGFDTLNFFTTESSYVYDWLNLCYDSLISYDDDYNAVARAAKDWEVSDDGLTWTFYLRDDIKFSDGEPLTSADVKFTYENAGDSYMYSTHAGGIESIECPDDYTVVFHCEEPKADMLYQIIPILPEHIWAAQNDMFSFEPTELVGSGPFIYSAERSGNGSTTFVKNENYWGTIPSIDVLVFTEYDNYDTMARALTLGEVDACTSLQKTQKDTLEGVEGIDVGVFESFDFEFIGYNMLDSITGDKTIRQALDYCTDKDLVVEMSYSGLGDVADGAIGNDGYRYEPAEKRGFDIAKANKLLDAAGYKDTNGDGIREMNGKPISIEVITASERSSWQSATVNMLITNCAKAGIEITWNPMEKTAMWDTCYDGNPEWQMTMDGWGGDADPAFILCIFQDYEDSGYAGVSYQNSKFDELYSKACTTVDPAKRADYINQCQAILYEDCPYTFLCYNQVVQAINSAKWTGYSANSHGYFQNEKIDLFLNIKLA